MTGRAAPTPPATAGSDLGPAIAGRFQRARRAPHLANTGRSTIGTLGRRSLRFGQAAGRSLIDRGLIARRRAPVTSTGDLPTRPAVELWALSRRWLDGRTAGGEVSEGTTPDERAGLLPMATARATTLAGGRAVGPSDGARRLQRREVRTQQPTERMTSSTPGWVPPGSLPDPARWRLHQGAEPDRQRSTA
ncbi:MAG: hypothetical protein JWM47_1405, partial [Acidimicrobiales bacterium]|nr:hypothetical protein [Acidimicrobiales bacterium]